MEEASGNAAAARGTGISRCTKAIPGKASSAGTPLARLKVELGGAFGLARHRRHLAGRRQLAVQLVMGGRQVSSLRPALRPRQLGKGVHAVVALRDQEGGGTGPCQAVQPHGLLQPPRPLAVAGHRQARLGTATRVCQRRRRLYIIQPLQHHADGGCHVTRLLVGAGSIPVAAQVCGGRGREGRRAL